MTFLTRFERFDPLDELATLRSRMDRLWPRVTPDEEPLFAKWTPASDIVENGDEILVTAELPGIEPKDVEVKIENGVLTMSGERKAEKEITESDNRRIERSYGSFFRSFTLPPNVQTDKIAANFVNGLLEIHMPKKAEAKPRTINVEVKKQLKAASAA